MSCINTTIIQFFFIFRSPTSVDRSTSQIDNNITVGQRLNQMTGHILTKHRSSKRKYPVSFRFSQKLRKMFAYISGGSGNYYIHMDPLFFNYTRKRIKSKKSSLKKVK